MSKNKIDIKTIFSGLQQQMEARLTLNKKVIKHPTTKGDASELEWADMLSVYLPKRYCIDKAFVIDYEGNVSEQIDLVIFDRHYSPFILKQNGAIYLPAECIYAVIEIKPDLSLSHLKYAAKKATSVRKLKRTTATIVQADNQKFKQKDPPKILAGILTLNGNLSVGMKQYLQNLKEENRLNFGCSLSGVLFTQTNYDPYEVGDVTYEFKTLKDNPNSLILFFLNLLQELRKMGTVPAMDLEKYIKNIK